MNEPASRYLRLRMHPFVPDTTRLDPDTGAEKAMFIGPFDSVDDAHFVANKVVDYFPKRSLVDLADPDPQDHLVPAHPALFSTLDLMDAIRLAGDVNRR